MTQRRFPDLKDVFAYGVILAMSLQGCTSPDTEPSRQDPSVSLGEKHQIVVHNPTDQSSLSPSWSWSVGQKFKLSTTEHITQNTGNSSETAATQLIRRQMDLVVASVSEGGDCRFTLESPIIQVTPWPGPWQAKLSGLLKAAELSFINDSKNKRVELTTRPPESAMLDATHTAFALNMLLPPLPGEPMLPGKIIESNTALNLGSHSSGLALKRQAQFSGQTVCGPNRQQQCPVLSITAEVTIGEAKPLQVEDHQITANGQGKGSAQVILSQNTSFPLEVILRYDVTTSIDSISIETGEKSTIRQNRVVLATLTTTGDTE